MALRVLLINAPPFKVLEPWYDTPSFPRSGLGYLAGYLRQNLDVEIRIIDAKFERLSFEETVERTLDWQPDIVGLTAFTNEINPAAHLAGLIKARQPNITIVIGGVHVTALPEETMRQFPMFDIGVNGEGEITFYELCRAIKAGEEWRGISGLVFRNSDEIKKTPERAKTADLDQFPYPAYDLLPRGEEYWVMTQRGCPFSCTYCFNPNGRVPRQRSIENVIGELELLMNNYAPKIIRFGDEIFSVNIPRTRILLDEMIRIGVSKRLKFWVETHVAFTSYELFDHLKRAGCFRVGMGIETGDRDKLKEMGKGTDIALIEKAFADARRANLDTESFFIIGHPNETSKSIRNTIKFACKLNPSLPIFGVMTPYPGTEVGRLAAAGKAGYRLISSDWSKLNKQLGGALEFADLPRWKIECYQLLGYFSVFALNYRFGDLLRFFWNYRTAGIALVAKILVGFFKLKGVEHKVEQVPSERLRTVLMAATDSWQQHQISSAKSVRQSAAPDSVRVVAQKHLR